MVNKARYYAFNASCIGASHIGEGKPCQDYSLCHAERKTAIAAVADGHGADIHFRSGRGARFAAETAFRCIGEFVKVKTSPLRDPYVLLSALEKSIVAAWYEKIVHDIKKDPFEAITNGIGILEPYGTTLIAAAVTEHYWFAIHIGDGKCVVINEDNEAYQPVPWDERCFLTQTTSLCDEAAGDLFRHFYSETLPSAVFLGSDGIDDSFPVNENEKHLARFYLSIYENFVREGLRNGEAQLREMLPRFTKKGSGDDVSIAGIIRSIKP
jgi:hypothetical protein